MFTDALEAEGVPLELKYLPVIESALNAKAYSPAGASGLWQFIPSTGVMYGLKVNSLVDERRDPVKSSRAAALYLKHLYSIYHDWTLVIAAYNCGPGNVNKAIRRADGVKDYWAIYKYLPQETRGYVPAFIAATYAMNYYKEHRICPAHINRTIVVDTIQVSKRVHLKQIAAVLDIDINELRNLNPQYRHDIIPGNGVAYTLALPVNKLNQFEMYENTILAYNVPGYVEHRPRVEPEGMRRKNEVVKNVAADSVARKEGVDSAKVNMSSQKALAAVNPKRDPKAKNGTAQKKSVELKKEAAQNKVATKNAEQVVDAKQAVGAEKGLEKPAQKNMSKAADEKKLAETKKTVPEKYTVKRGDTLYSIAMRNKVTVQNLKKWNSLNSDDLRTGQVIVVKGEQ